MNEVLQGDCLKLMSDIPDKSIDLIVIDPPYNIGKDHWDKIKNYIDWMGLVFLECQRVLKDNGSFYFFHNDFLQIVELQNWINRNTRFVFKSLITLDKTDNNYIKDLYGSQCHFRNYLNLAEYCLFYTFQDETGLTTVMLDTNNFSTLRKYFKEFQQDTGLNKKQIMDLVGQKADHCFRWGSSQWDLPTEETYNELLQLPHLNGFVRKDYNTLRQEYESLRQEYESLRQEYESLRYTFNNQKTHHSVWDYEVADKFLHITPKPIALVENIILHSSNEGDTVLDCFGGSGTTAIACINTNRNYILIEKEEKYFNLINDRIAKHKGLFA